MDCLQTEPTIGLAAEHERKWPNFGASGQMEAKASAHPFGPIGWLALGHIFRQRLEP